MGLIRRHTNPAYATPPDAINFLASACDRAHKRDGWGFGSDHVEIGHYLANTPPVGWQPLDHQTAANLIRIYQQQLANAGFNPRDLLGQTKPLKLSKRRHKKVAASQGWQPDPTGLWQWRYWNGARWTHNTLNAHP